MIKGNINDWRDFWEKVVIESTEEIYDEEDFLKLMIDLGYHINDEEIMVNNQVIKSCPECPNKRTNRHDYCGLQYNDVYDAYQDENFWEFDNERPEIDKNCPLRS